MHDIIWFVWFFEQDDLRVLFERNFLRKADLSGWWSTLIICQIKPRMMCSRFYKMNWGWMLTTVHPIALADSIAKFRFSILWYTFAQWRLIAAGEMGGTFPKTAALMSLLTKRRFTTKLLHRRQPRKSLCE